MSFPSNTKRFHDGIMILQNSENDIFQNTLSKKKKENIFQNFEHDSNSNLSAAEEMIMTDILTTHAIHIL